METATETRWKRWCGSSVCRFGGFGELESSVAQALPCTRLQPLVSLGPSPSQTCANLIVRPRRAEHPFLQVRAHSKMHYSTPPHVSLTVAALPYILQDHEKIAPT
jgi:hypothetical protein